MLKVVGGGIVAKIPSWRDDFTEYKYKLIDAIDYDYYYVGVDSYIIKEQENNDDEIWIPPVYADERKIDYYNGYELDDDNELVIMEDYVIHDNLNELDEEIYIKRTKKFHNFILHINLTLYQCDACGKNFATYKNHYEDIQSRRKKSIIGHDDLCLSCREKVTKENRALGFQKAMYTMSKNQSVTTSKQQKYLANLLSGELNQVVCGYFADILLDGDIVVEYDGSGHWLKERYQGTTREQINKADRNRDRIMIKNGYKVIRIISKKDYLPSDKQILQIIEDAVSEFDSGEKFYAIEITEEFFGKNNLRKIANDDVLEVITSGER